MERIVLIKSQLMADLFAATDERIALIEKFGDEFQYVESVDIIKEWEMFYNRIRRIWHLDTAPFEEIESRDADEMAFYFDFVAQFFLENGSQADDQYLKDVDAFFSQYHKEIGKRGTMELFNRAFKNLV